MTELRCSQCDYVAFFPSQLAGHMAIHTRCFDAARDMRRIPRRDQTQRALNEQLLDLANVANRLGLYDAATFIRDRLSNSG